LTVIIRMTAIGARSGLGNLVEALDALLPSGSFAFGEVAARCSEHRRGWGLERVEGFEGFVGARGLDHGKLAERKLRGRHSIHSRECLDRGNRTGRRDGGRSRPSGWGNRDG